MEPGPLSMARTWPFGDGTAVIRLTSGERCPETGARRRNGDRARLSSLRDDRGMVAVPPGPPVDAGRGTIV